MDEWPGADAFEWVGGTWRSEAACVTFVEDDDVERVAASFGGRVDHAVRVRGERPPEEAPAVVGDQVPGARRFGEGLPVALFARRGGWVMAFEDNGGEGVRAEVLQRVARVVESEAMRRLRGYPDGVSYTAPGHALAVQALMRATEPGPPANTAYRTIRCADEVRQDLEQDVAGLREVVMRAFAAP
ncbi:hypothetical protein [Actinomadura rugatobispora]|uniref:Uncharacterized protein n=1 Tax=Actinomadura rugatobispora TaxID=1994 RepID=A0ABW1A8F4_9ACTN|nr:hypothetical protein GCM10010200_079020 [Actinomadura rugatobispora]